MLLTQLQREYRNLAVLFTLFGYVFCLITQSLYYLAAKDNVGAWRGVVSLNRKDVQSRRYSVVLSLTGGKRLFQTYLSDYIINVAKIQEYIIYQPMMR